MCSLARCSSLPPIPKGLMTLTEHSPPAQEGWTQVPRQPASASMSARLRPSLPKGAECAHAAALTAPGQGLVTSFFFFFLWKSTFSRRVTIFSILSSPVGGKLLNWGRQQQQEEVPSFSVSYLPCWYRQVPDNSYYYLLLPPYTTVTTVRDKEKKNIHPVLTVISAVKWHQHLQHKQKFPCFLLCISNCWWNQTSWQQPFTQAQLA